MNEKVRNNSDCYSYVYMLSKVKREYWDKIVPCYHFGEPIEYLHRICIYSKILHIQT